MRQFIPTMAIELSQDRFDKWIIEGHSFAWTVYGRAVVLYDDKEKQPLFNTDENAVTVEKEITQRYTAG